MYRPQCYALVFPGESSGSGFSLSSPGRRPSYWGTFILRWHYNCCTGIGIWERPPSRMRKRSPLIRKGSIQVPFWPRKYVYGNSTLEVKGLWNARGVVDFWHSGGLKWLWRFVRSDFGWIWGHRKWGHVSKWKNALKRLQEIDLAPIWRKVGLKR